MVAGSTILVFASNYYNAGSLLYIWETRFFSLKRHSGRSIHELDMYDLGSRRCPIIKVDADYNFSVDLRTASLWQDIRNETCSTKMLRGGYTAPRSTLACSCGPVGRYLTGPTPFRAKLHAMSNGMTKKTENNSPLSS